MKMLHAIYATLALCATETSASPSTILADEQCFPDALRGFSWLSEYDPAITYCENLFPNAATTRTFCTITDTNDTSTVTRSELERLSRRYNQEAIFNNLLQQRQSTIEAVCWCIASSKVTTTIAVCGEGQTCDSSKGICKAVRNCQNPARCDPSSRCSGGSASDCYCHPDVEDSDAGYCMGNGPPGNPCPKVFEDCSSNSDCGGAKVCILACCRKEAFCVEIVDYSCLNTLQPSRLFRRMNDRGVSGMNPQ